MSVINFCVRERKRVFVFSLHAMPAWEAVEGEGKCHIRLTYDSVTHPIEPIT